MHGPKSANADVLWSQEGDAWIGTLGDGGASGHGFYEVEVLLRAEDWHVEMSQSACGGFVREHIAAADAEEAKTKAADLLRAFRDRSEAANDNNDQGR